MKNKKPEQNRRGERTRVEPCLRLKGALCRQLAPFEFKIQESYVYFPSCVYFPSRAYISKLSLRFQVASEFPSRVYQVAFVVLIYLEATTPDGCLLLWTLGRS